MIACGLDFGTSNSAIGVARDGTAALAPVEASDTLMPSAVFFDYEVKGRVLFGNEAVSAYVGQTEGRLMRALKSILGSPLIDEETSLGGRKVPLREVVEIFVRHLKHKAEAFAGQEITAVVHGRPVRFVDDDDTADARAQAVLEAIARRVGFRDVAFVYEPIAAAHHYEQTVQGEELALIADIGGGTSDFSVIRVGPQRRDAPRSQPGRARECRRARGRHRLRRRAQPRRGDAAPGPRHAARREEPADAERALSRAGDLGDDQLRLHLQERARARRAGPAGLRARESGTPC